MSHIKSEKVSCSSIYGKSKIDFDSGHFCYDYTYFYKYNELLNKKMELFGNDSQLAKEAFGNKITKYDYISKKDGFVWLDFSGGGDCHIPTESIITSAKIIENELKVTLIEKEYDSDEYDKGNKIVSSEEKREYIFRKQNNNYYLAEINKVN
ncbi:MAG: hypothetical protein IJD87_05380, partial [Turicibacter sp.]|nr:hypothetical protein [Turicibacter sp.]